MRPPFRREKDCVFFLPSHCHCCHWIRRNLFIHLFIHPFILERVCAPGAFMDTDMYPSWQGIVCTIPTSPFPSAPWLHPRVVGAFSDSGRHSAEWAYCRGCLPRPVCFWQRSTELCCRWSLWVRVPPAHLAQPPGALLSQWKTTNPFFSVSGLRSSKWQSISTVPCWKSPSLNPFWDEHPKTMSKSTKAK